MKIKLRGLTLALAALSTVSFADVNIYGKIAAGIEDDQFQNSTAPGTGSVQDYGSYFGIRGADSVYGETAVIWQVEQYLDIASGQAYNSTSGGGLVAPNAQGGAASSLGSGHLNNQVNTLASSETYIGLQGAFGRVRLGNIGDFQRDNMGITNMFNSANGVNGLQYSRTGKLIPTSIRYDSPSWAGFNMVAMYGFNSSGLTGVSGVNGFNTFSQGLNGDYSGGIYSLGVNWANGNWGVALGTTIWQNVGSYTTGTNGMSTSCVSSNGGQICYPNASYGPAYANTLEINYNDPDGLIANMAFQTTNGFGMNSWPNSGGAIAMGTATGGATATGMVYNPGYQAVATQLGNTNAMQMQEIAISLGYHLGAWTPKVGYGYANNMMTGGGIGDVIDGSAQQIANSGYQQAVAELDWNITPRTIAFVNFGQIWYGSTLTNVSFVGNNSAGQFAVNGSNAYQNNQSTVAMGFSHTF